jgi:hypothetical protein
VSNQREGDLIVTEDGAVVAKGDVVYNYYDMWPGQIVTNPDDQGWFYVKPLKGVERQQQALLNGPRICSLAFAKRRGFKFP